jgi:hypothetical protein
VLTVYVAVPCCVEFAGDAPHQNQEANRGAEQSARCSDAVAWPVVSDKDQAKATTSNNEDKAPSKIECEDLKAQRRMAVAAERSLQLGCYQFWLGILGALLLLGTVIYTAISANAAADAARAALNSERAFVKMSHEPPGLTLDPVAGTATVSVQVQNSGRTPADVIGVNLSARVLATGEKLPKVPEYSPNTGLRRGKAFLVADDEIFIPFVHRVEQTDINRIYSDDARLYLFGYVDYVDRMTGKITRAGYGRVFRPNPSRGTNLAFIDEAGYHYDRLRLPSEASDWDQTE